MSAEWQVVCSSNSKCIYPQGISDYNYPLYFHAIISFFHPFLTFTFTFMHLADAFIQSDLHCIQVTVVTFYQLLPSLGIEPMILALLAPCSTS